MAGAITEIEKQGSAAWMHTFSGTAPFRIYQSCDLIEDAYTETTLLIASTTDDYDLEEPPQIEVLDSTDTADSQQVQWPANLELQWRRSEGAGVYIIEQYVSAAWVERGRVGEDDYNEYYTFKTKTLADGETHQFRVTARDSRGYSSNPITFEVFEVCNPEPPSITATYDALNVQIDFTARA
jgi:hypothetical protein